MKKIIFMALLGFGFTLSYSFEPYETTLTRQCQEGYGNDCWDLCKAYRKGLKVMFGQSIAKDEKKALQACKKSCDLGNKKGCYAAGIMTADDIKELIVLCEKGFQEECDFIGSYIIKQRDYQNYPNAITYLKKSCVDGAGDVESCRLLSKLYEGQYGGQEVVPEDLPQALDFYIKIYKAENRESFRWKRCEENNTNPTCVSILALRAKMRTKCDTNNAKICDSLGRSVLENDYDSQNYENAIKDIEKACELGFVDSCTRASNFYMNDFNAKDSQKAFIFSQKACDLGDADLCNKFGNEYSKDLPKAFIFNKKACDKGDSSACNNVGIAYYNGKGVAQDFSKAFEFFKKACEMDNMEGCIGVGVMYRDGTGVAKDDTKSFQFIKKVCDMGYALGCNDVGYAYQHGKGVKQNKDSAKNYYKKACSMGEKIACDNFTNLLRGGR